MKFQVSSGAGKHRLFKLHTLNFTPPAGPIVQNKANFAGRAGNRGFGPLTDGIGAYRLPVFYLVGPIKRT